MLEQGGQSLVEFALAVPVLLLILLGLADFGRAFYYTTAIANAARAGAEYAAKNAGTGPTVETQTAYRVCNETGFVAYSPTATCPGMTVVVSPSPPVAGGDVVKVTVTYDFNLFSAYLVSRIVGDKRIPLRAQATFPVLR
jgi:Flp pilus assembly protein TadG